MLSHDDPINHHSMFMLYIIPYANLPLPKNQVIIPNYSVITKSIRKIVGFVAPYFTMRLSAAAAASWSAPFWRPCEVLRTSIEFVIARLVGGFNNLEKYEFVNGKDDIPYMKWKIELMFQTTNQQRVSGKLGAWDLRYPTINDEANWIVANEYMICRPRRVAEVNPPWTLITCKNHANMTSMTSPKTLRFWFSHPPRIWPPPTSSGASPSGPTPGHRGVNFWFHHENMRMGI